MHIYCINLDKRDDRRRSAEAEFAREGLDVEFFSATDGRINTPKGLCLTPSEYGCVKSHVRIWRDIVENGYESALIFEDDVRLVDNFKVKFNSILDELKGISWDIIHLGPILPIQLTQVTPSLFEGQALGTHAYIISLECAKKISVFEAELIKVSPDFQLNRFPLKFLCVNEPLAKQENIEQPPLVGVLESWFTGDIGLERTVDFTYFFRYSFQKFKHYIIVVILLLIAWFLSLGK
jgi:GR25 family glycosyltransferase involved in LPS biosynthesis